MQLVNHVIMATLKVLIDSGCLLYGQFEGSLQVIPARFVRERYKTVKPWGLGILKQDLSMNVREKRRFAAFEIDLQAHELLRNGRAVKVAPQTFRLLEFLASHSGRLVTREEIRKEIWSDTTFVD